MGDALPKRSTRRRLRQPKPQKLTNATPSPEREFAHLAPESDVVRPTRETHGAPWWRMRSRTALAGARACLMPSSALQTTVLAAERTRRRPERPSSIRLMSMPPLSAGRYRPVARPFITALLSVFPSTRKRLRS